jgi:hypothetical protein
LGTSLAPLRLDKKSRLKFALANHNRALDQRMRLNQLLGDDRIELFAIAQNDYVIPSATVLP